MSSREFLVIVGGGLEESFLRGGDDIVRLGVNDIFIRNGCDMFRIGCQKCYSPPIK